MDGGNYLVPRVSAQGEKQLRETIDKKRAMLKRDSTQTSTKLNWIMKTYLHVLMN